MAYLILGGGGHAAVLAEILLEQGKEIAAVVAPELYGSQSILSTFDHIKSDDDVLAFDKHEILLVNGIGAMPNNILRTRIYEYFTALDYKFSSVISDAANISKYSHVENGVQILTAAVVGHGARIGVNTIINTSASVDHHCSIGRHCHIAPGVSMSGDVTVENNVHVGTGANIINNVVIGDGSVIGVGANILTSVAAGSIMFGARATLKQQGGRE